MPSVFVDGQQLFYRTHTSKAQEAAWAYPLLLVHGAGGTLLHWPPHLRRLPPSAVYALDLPGHGQSAGPGRTTITGYREAVQSFANTLGLGRFVLAGHSMGGAIALDFVRHHPERLVGLGLVSTGSRLPVAPAILEGVRSDFAATTEQIAWLSYSAQTDQDLRQTYLRHLQEVDATLLHGDFLACNTFDIRAHLSTIAVPTLIICGVQDRMTPPKYSELLRARLPHGELHLVDKAGHMVMLEQPALVTELFRNFVESVSQRTNHV